MKVVSPERKEARLATLNKAISSLAERIARNDPADADKRDALKERLDEYKQSVENLNKFHAETL